MNSLPTPKKVKERHEAFMNPEEQMYISTLHHLSISSIPIITADSSKEMMVPVTFPVVICSRWRVRQLYIWSSALF